MDLRELGETAAEFAGLWTGNSGGGRARVVETILDSGLMAIWVFDHLPARIDSGDRNDLAFALAMARRQRRPVDGEGSMSQSSERATHLAEMWNSATVDARARVLRQVHDDGMLAVWVFDHLPPDGESKARYQLGTSLLALTEILEGQAAQNDAPRP